MGNNDEKEVPKDKDSDELRKGEALLTWLLDPDTSIAEIIFDFD